MPKRQIYLVPGFFGFDAIGAFNYFLRVKVALQRYLAEYNCEAEVIDCQTQPTGSIRRRAIRLINEVVEDGGLDADELYFVAHSTGGLDARLLLTPGVRLRPDKSGACLADKTRSLVTVATPHFGTPLATFFTTFAGRQMLQLLTSMALSGPGRVGIFASARLATTAANIGSRLGRKDSAINYWVENLLKYICGTPDGEFWTFLREVASDQGAIVQLTPEGMDLFNASVIDRSGVDYRCLVTASPPRRARSFERIKLRHLPSMAMFDTLYRIAAAEHAHYPYPWDGCEQAAKIDSQLPFALSAKTNDGVVPTLSQIYGDVLDTVVADHLDIVGQFPNAGGRLQADWLPSGSGFFDAEFQQAWKGVAKHISDTALRATPSSSRDRRLRQQQRNLNETAEQSLRSSH